MVTIDLQADVVEVQQMLVDAVNQYAGKHRAPHSAKTHPFVTRIDLVFSLGDSESTPWLSLHFDTKPGGEPDGDPTHPDFFEMVRENWLPAVKAVCKGKNVRVIQHNGHTRKCGDDELTEEIGNFLVAMLLEARERNVFTDLPRADRCELGVEDPNTGEFGWPNYEDRGKNNLV